MWATDVARSTEALSGYAFDLNGVTGVRMSGGRQMARPSHRPAAYPDPRRARQCREKFLDFFPEGFRDPAYLETERDYKWDAHRRWVTELGSAERADLCRRGEYERIARRAIGIEARTNLLFSFEKMAIRDAVSQPEGARRFSIGLARWLTADVRAASFARWVHVLDSLPRRQTRVVTWPTVSVFGFLARPRTHMFLKPNVTRHAAAAYGYPFCYASSPRWETYASLLEFAKVVRRDLRDLRPRDMIDIQSFIWVQGSDEYD